MEEIWKDVYFIENDIEWDYRELYQISNLGRVKSLGNNKNKKEKILKNRKDKHGYLVVTLCKNGTQKTFKIHRLIGHLFIDGYFNGAEIDHINTNPLDNCIENLRWVTSKENSNNELTRKHNSQANTGKNNPQARKVYQYDKQGKLIKIWDYINQAEEELGIAHQNITKCCKGKVKSAGGFIWKYAEDIE